MATRNYPTKKFIKEANYNAINSLEQLAITALNGPMSNDPYSQSGITQIASSVGRGWQRDNIEFRSSEDTFLPKRFVSAEIELNHCGARDFRVYKNEWAKIISVCSGVKTDGSVSGESIELNTMPAKGGVYHKQMDILKEAFKTVKAKANNSCGLHVHVDCRDLQPRHLFKLANIWACVEDEMTELIKPGRAANNFCKKFTDTSKKSWLEKKFNLDSTLASNKERILNHFSHDRYHALNFTALNTHNTVEFRLHHGTANAEIIRNWGILCSEIVEYSKTCTFKQSRQATLNVIAKSKKLKSFIENKKKTVIAKSIEVSESDIFGF